MLQTAPNAARAAVQSALGGGATPFQVIAAMGTFLREARKRRTVLLGVVEQLCRAAPSPETHVVFAPWGSVSASWRGDRRAVEDALASRGWWELRAAFLISGIGIIASERGGPAAVLDYLGSALAWQIERELGRRKATAFVRTLERCATKSS